MKDPVEMELVEEKRYGSIGIRMLRPGPLCVSIQLKKDAGLKIKNRARIERIRSEFWVFINAHEI